MRYVTTIVGAKHVPTEEIITAFVPHGAEYIHLDITRVSVGIVHGVMLSLSVLSVIYIEKTVLLRILSTR